MVATLFSQKWALLAVLVAVSVSSVLAIFGYEDNVEREELFLPGPIGNTKLPFGLCDEIRRRPKCVGPASNGCDCDNSEWQCKDGIDAATSCTVGNVKGECAVSREGNPYCTGGNTGLCSECKSSSDCSGGNGEVCIWVGKTFRTECVKQTDYFCRESFICVKLL